MFDNINFIIITIDSCRWDTFSKASMPFLKSKTTFRKAYSQGTYTLPAHKSIYQGIFPSVNEDIPYYNRFSKAIFRIAHRSVNANSLITFKGGTTDIISGFKNEGYYTFGIGAMEWFKHPELTANFDEFHYTGIDAINQVNLFFDITGKLEKPFFSLINFGETHEPYEYGKYIKPNLQSRARMRAFQDFGYLKTDYEKQVKSCEYLDSIFKLLIEKIETQFKLGTVVVVCSDHGDCFGEDGFYGHGFYHEKIMEVPLGIFELNCSVL